MSSNLDSYDLRAFRQERYKKMSVEASCRKYLDALALRLSSYYEFNHRHESGTTIGDVLAAKDGVWHFKRYVKDCYQIDSNGFETKKKKGQPFLN